MLLAQVVLMGFILYISGVSGKQKNICALKGSSLVLPCSVEHPTSGVRWYMLHRSQSRDVHNKIPADGGRFMYNTSKGSDFALTITDLRQSDEKIYCCREAGTLPACQYNSTKLHVTDLQVKVTPTTEGQTVTLTCSTSCSLTEEPAVYIWYKNGEFLYEDWSPWYQELVSSDAAVRYSCAVKGYEYLSSPEVSVDLITWTCFNVTYAKGKMCSYQHNSEDKPCSITYPREIGIQMSSIRDYMTMTCNSSCPMADSQTAFTWFWANQLYDCENQHITVFRITHEIVFCAIKGHEGLQSRSICTSDNSCWIVNYASRRICALEGFSVNISSEFTYPNTLRSTEINWHERRGDKFKKIENKSIHVWTDEMERHSMLTINNLQRKDSTEYALFLQNPSVQYQYNDLIGVQLIITGLKVMMAPSEVVTEGQRVTLTCSTSCPLTSKTQFIWYLNGRPLTQTQGQNKHQVLDPVSWQHAGNYSCAVENVYNISSPEETLIVIESSPVLIMNIIKLVLLLLFLPTVYLFHLLMRKILTFTTGVSNIQLEQDQHKDVDDVGLAGLQEYAL